MSHTRLRLRHDDPVYYKCAIQELLEEAKENGISISLGEDVGGQTKLYFKADNGECAGAVLLEKPGYPWHITCQGRDIITQFFPECGTGTRGKHDPSSAAVL